MCRIRSRRWRGRSGVRPQTMGRSRCVRCGRMRQRKVARKKFPRHVEVGGVLSVMKVKGNLVGRGGGYVSEALPDGESGDIQRIPPKRKERAWMERPRVR